MKSKSKTVKLLSLLLCFVLIAAAAFTMSSCKNDNRNTLSEASSPNNDGSVTAIGEGNTKFIFTVTDETGKQKTYEVSTSEKTVGSALQKLGLIEGEDSQYGLYIKKVDNIVADYETNGTYWAFYINGEYATTGADSTDIDPNSKYELRVEK